MKKIVLSLLLCFATTNVSFARKPNMNRRVCQWKNAKTSVGKMKDFLGWDVYTPPIKCNRKQTDASKPTLATKEGAMFKFYGDWMNQKSSIASSLSPKLNPTFRTCLLKNLPKGKTIKRFFLHAAIHSSKNGPKQGNRHSRRYFKIGKMLFQSFDYLVFGELNDSRTDVIMYVEKHKGKWYMKGILLRSLEKCLKPLFPKKKK